MDIESPALDQPASLDQSTPGTAPAGGTGPTQRVTKPSGSGELFPGGPSGSVVELESSAQSEPVHDGSGAPGAPSESAPLPADPARPGPGSPAAAPSDARLDSMAPSDPSFPPADPAAATGRAGGPAAALTALGGIDPAELNGSGRDRSAGPIRPPAAAGQVRATRTATSARPAGQRRPAGPAGPVARLDPAVPALLLRLDWNPAHHATLGVIRSLGRAGVPVHAVLEHPKVPAARSRYLAQGHPWLPADAEPERLIDRLRRMAERIGGRPVLYPMDDAGALLLAAHGAPLAEVARFPGVDPTAPARVADKEQLAELCRRAGVGCPETRVPTRPEEVRAAVADLGLPLIAKWSRPWLLRRGGGLKSTTVVTRAAEAERLFTRRAEAGCSLLLQRMIAPTPGGDRFFHGYFTRADESADGFDRGPADGFDLGPGTDGGPVVCRFGAAGRKDLAWPREAGLTARGTWLPDPEIEAAACLVVQAAGFTGVVDLDFRFDPASGRYALLDFNPRLGAQFRLFTDPAGLDVPRAVHLDLSGRTIPPLASRPGRRLCVETYDPLGALNPSGEVERAWFARDDLAPFPVAVLGSGTRLLRRILPNLRSSSNQEGNAS